MEVETPLHPSARRTGGKIDSSVCFRLDPGEYIFPLRSLRQVSDSMDELRRTMQLASLSMLQLQKPLSLITLSGV
jgi:hypothetical protein